MRERAVSREFQMGQRDFTLLARPSRPSLPPAPPALKLRTAAAAARDPCRIIFAYYRRCQPMTWTCDVKMTASPGWSSYCSLKEYFRAQKARQKEMPRNQGRRASVDGL